MTPPATDTQPDALRTPPHSIEAEQSVLGGLLLDNTALPKVAGILDPTFFFRADHREIYVAIASIIADGNPADALTLAENLKIEGRLDNVGGHAYIVSLALNTPSAANIGRYAEIVAEKARRRQLGAIANELQHAAHSGTAVPEIIAQARDQLAALPADTRNAPFRPVWLADAATPTHTEYLIKGLIDRGSLIVIYGPSGDGKTFFTADLSAHIACGRQWRGRRVRPALVAYVAAEAGASILRRFCAWRDQRAADHDGERIPLAILTRGANLLDVTDVTALIASLRTLADQAGLPVGLVVFDTLSRSMPGGDENGPESMTQVVGATDRIRDELGAACAVVHHSGKDMGRGARGHSSLKGAADTVLKVVDRVATIEKSRDGMAGEKFAFDLEVVMLGEDPDGDPITTCIVVPTDPQPPAIDRKRRLGADEQIGLDTLRDEISATGERLPETSVLPGGKHGVLIENWRVRLYSRLGDDRDITNDSKRKVFQRGSKGLVARKVIGINGLYAWIW